MDSPSEQPIALYIRLLIDLHQLIGKGLCDSDEAEALRDQMDPIWYRMSATDRELAGIISADLDMLSDDEVYRPASEDERAPQLFRERFYEAWSHEKWDDILRLLRTGPPFLFQRPAMVAYLRARAYGQLGFPDLAARFFDHASHLAPANSRYAALALDALGRSGAQEAVARAEQIITSQDADISLVFEATSVLYRNSLAAPREAAQLTRARVTNALAGALARRDIADPTYGVALVASAYILLALCLADRGHIEEAIDACKQSLTIEPESAIAEIAIDHFRALTSSTGRSPYATDLIWRLQEQAAHRGWSKDDAEVLEAA